MTNKTYTAKPSATQLFRTVDLYARLARPLQLVAIFLVYSWGYLLSLDTLTDLQPLPYLGSLAVLLFVSASVHYANEYADYETDILTQRTPFSGGSGAMLMDNAPRDSALHAARISLGIAAVLAILAYAGGWLPAISLALLIAGTLGGWMYSLPPLALAWHGWGEATNALLGGMLLPLFGYSIQAGPITADVVLMSLPFSLLAFLNLLATTWADKQADAQAGKYTLATRWSRKRLRLLYLLVAAAAYTIMLVMRGWLLDNVVIWICFLLLLPLTIWAGWVYTRRHSPFPSVFVMVLYLLVQLGSRLATLWQLELIF